MVSVTLSNVQKSFGSAVVIYGVTINIADGEFVVLMGAPYTPGTLERPLQETHEVKGLRHGSVARAGSGVGLRGNGS